MLSRSVQFVKQAAPGGWVPLILLVSSVIVASLVYVLVVIPRQSPSWNEQIQMALNAAQRVDEDAALFRIRADTPRDFPNDQLFMPDFDFFTPSGRGFFVKLERKYTVVVARVKETVSVPRSTFPPPPPDFVKLGTKWFYEAARRIQVSPAEAVTIAQTAIQDAYPDAVVPTPPLSFTSTGSEIAQQYGTRTVWLVVGGAENQEDVIVIIDAETGEVLAIDEFTN